MRIIRRLRFALVIPALALLPLAGCFDTTKPSELSCTQSKYCPDGYVCVGAQTGSPGKCQKPADAGGFDVPIVVDSADSIDGRANTDGPVPPNDGPTTNTDMPAAIDQAPSLDTSNEPDTASDLPASADLDRDVPSDAPILLPDMSVDNTVPVPDLGPDQKPEGPEVGPDAPSTSCVIGGTSYASGAANPANACQVCKPTTSSLDWSSADEGTSCGSGQFCDAGTCKAGCFISGAYYANGAANPANACQTCQTAYALTSWTTSTNGMSCGTGQVCSGGTCQSGCWIDGALVGSGTTNASNACQSCKPATSTSEWSSNTDGKSCGTGRTCAAGKCQCTAGTDCGTSGCIDVNGTDSNHCGSCTNVCSAGQSCTSGKCACVTGAPACGGCLAWDFEWGSDPSPWVRELAPNLPGSDGATNLQVTHSQYHSGSGSASLIAPILIDASSSFNAEVAASTSCTINLAGYSISAWVYISGPALDRFNDGLQIDTWGPSDLGDRFVLYWGNVPIGSWFQITYAFTSDVLVNRIGIRLAPSTNWQGTMYIDDVVITGL